MKPTPLTTSNPRRSHEAGRFPVTDFHYHFINISDYKASCTKGAAASFRDVSRDYFNEEESADFLLNAFVFGLMSLTAALPLWSAAKAILDLLGTVSF